MNYTTIPPNGDGDEAGITLLFFTLSSFVLAAITIALRLWVRRMRNQPLAVSDWLLILGWVCLPLLRVGFMLIAQGFLIRTNYCDCPL